MLNTKALESTGLLNSMDKDVIRDEKGEVAGVVVERALDKVEGLIHDPYALDDYRGFMINATRHVSSLVLWPWASCPWT